MQNYTSPQHFPQLQPQAPKWKHISQVRQEGIDYVRARQQGLIKSLKTPWKSFNDAGVNGIEWGNVVVVGARPGVGKTAIVNNITRQAPILNPDQDIAVLDFQFEMSAKTTAVREFSSVTMLSFNELLSANFPIDQRQVDIMDAYTNSRHSDNIYQIEDVMSVEEMRQTILAFAAFIKRKFVVTIDHSLLVSGHDKFAMLSELGAMMTDVKKKIDVIFIVLTQMNRSIEDQIRKTPGTLGNYPTTADVYGSDSLLQHCDIMIGLNKPANMHLPYYGPEQFIVTPNLMAMHFLKVRNGELSVCFFETQFEKMMITPTMPGRKGGAAAMPPQAVAQAAQTASIPQNHAVPNSFLNSSAF